MLPRLVSPMIEQRLKGKRFIGLQIFARLETRTKEFNCVASRISYLTLLSERERLKLVHEVCLS